MNTVTMNIEDQEAEVIIQAGKRRLAWFIIAFFIFMCDQFSKWAVLEFFAKPNLGIYSFTPFKNWYSAPAEILEFTSKEVTSFFNLVLTWNTGVSFSLFSESGSLGTNLLILLALAITVLFLFWMFKTRYHRYGMCYALIIGGALGNVIDRIRFGAVIDFLDFHAFGYHWPAFNVADISIVLGICTLLLVTLFSRDKENTDEFDHDTND